MGIIDNYYDFAWQPKITPLSTIGSVLCCSAVYLLTIFSLRSLITRPWKLPRLIPATHNAILCLGSLAMLLGEGWEVLKVSNSSHMQ